MAQVVTKNCKMMSSTSERRQQATNKMERGSGVDDIKITSQSVSYDRRVASPLFSEILRGR
jgi:hypothetical protein